MRTKWFYCDGDGFLASTLYLSDDEYNVRQDKDRLSDVEWPTRVHPEIDQAALLKPAAIRHIKQQCEQDLSANIQVNGISLNADVSSISAKLFEIGASPGANTSWRDANNVTHQFTADELLDLLTSAMVAISQRNTSLRQAMWAKREAIEAAATIEEIAAIMG